MASSNRNFYSLNFVISRSYKVPGKWKNKVDFSKVPKIDFKNDVQEIFSQASGPGGMNLNLRNLLVRRPIFAKHFS